MKRVPNLYVIFRIAIGCLFVVSGFEKLMSPYQNFLYVIQNYEIIPRGADELIARTMPWIELVTGVFLVLGLWLKEALYVAWVLVTGFLIIVGQAIMRKLDIMECGCFGSLFAFPLQFVIILDSLIWISIGVLILSIKYTSQFSLDRSFAKKR